MKNQLAVEVVNVSKKYFLGQRGYRTFREDIYRFFNPKRKAQKNSSFYALNKISFKLKKGEILGIVGPNGAGKSTILKLLSDITLPSSGEIYKEGRIAAMIELAAGFHPELTGRENIYFYGSIMGMKNKEIDRRFKQIVDFAEIEESLDTPLKRYSSGMKARLGFSVSAHIDADILLIDEVLSVGDMSFQRKCFKRMEEYINNGTSIIFVSHNLESVRKLCKRTILLDKGEIIFDGNTENAISKYYEVVSSAQISYDSGQSYNNICEKKAEITDIQLLKGNDSRFPSFSFKTGDEAIFRYSVFFSNNLKYEDRKCAVFGFFIRKSDRVVVIDTSTELLKTKINGSETENKWIVEFVFHADLLKGNYTIGTYAGDAKTGKFWDYIDKAIEFYVTENICYDGIADLKAQCLILAGKA